MRTKHENALLIGSETNACVPTVKMAPFQDRLKRLENIQLAKEAVLNKTKTLRAASREFKIPFETLRRHVAGVSFRTTPGPVPKLGYGNESELKAAVEELTVMGHGVGVHELRELGQEVNETSLLEPFKNGLPSRGWARKFLVRNTLSLRTPENISSARMDMENSEVKEDFYCKLESLINHLKPRGLTGTQIYNMDETGLCLVSKGGKVIATKGSKRVMARKGGERGENITVVATANATGNIILPPTIIFKGESLNEDLMRGAMEGAVFAHSKKSFINTELFEEWFVRFLAFIPPMRPVLLLMDGHVSHLSFAAVKKAKENDIHILLLPPHTTHLYQPLDLSVFGPLKAAFKKECVTLTRKNKLKQLSRYHFCSVLKPAWEKAVTATNIMSGFKAGGIWPFDRNRVILPCEINVTTDVPLNDPIPGEAVDQPSRSNPSGGEAEVSQGEAASSSGSWLSAPCSSTDQVNCHDVTPVISVIRDFLKPIENVDRRSKRVTKARMITSEQFLKEMEAKEMLAKQKDEEKKRKLEEKAERIKENKKKQEEKKKLQEEKKRLQEKKKQIVQKKKSDKTSKKGKRRNNKRSVESEDSSIDEPLADASDEPTTANKENVLPPLSASVDSEDETPCNICKKVFQNEFNGEAWIKCVFCYKWYHNRCQNLKENEYQPDFNCSYCKSKKINSRSTTSGLRC